MYHLRTPKTEAEFDAYYAFRWEMLRKPLHQPEGSEKDGYDTFAHHQMVVDETGQPVAIGRLYINADNEGAIRFMAVRTDAQGKGLGTLVAMALESLARQEGIKRIVCSAREESVSFFEKLGYENCGLVTGPQNNPH